MSGVFKREFNPKVKNIKISRIVKISERAAEREEEFKKKGIDLIRFQRGELDLETPQYIKDALSDAAQNEEYTKYPKSGGNAFFKDAILEKIERDNCIGGVSRENILATYGGQEGLQLAFSLLEGWNGAGFSPCWSCVLDNFIPYSGVNFRQVPLLEDFSVDFSLLEKTMKEVDFFYLNNPHNPTGKVFSEEEVREIANMSKKHNLVMISDEAYEKIIYEGKKHFSAASLPFDNIISCFTLSKTYAIPGWRIGYSVTKNKEIAHVHFRRMDYTQDAGVSTPLQYAASVALRNKEKSDESIRQIVKEFQMRRDVLIDELKSVHGIGVNKPEGAFYVFPNFSKVIPSNLKKEERREYITDLLMEKGVVVVPGDGFGNYFDDNVRLSFSYTPVPVIKESGKRFREIFGEKKKSSLEENLISESKGI